MAGWCNSEGRVRRRGKERGRSVHGSEFIASKKEKEVAG
jgi:hypothetical protein